MNENLKTPENFAAWMAWQKYILKTHPDLTGTKCERDTLIAYCFAMSTAGTCGLECFASDATIAKDLEKYRPDTIGKYRRLALDLGWFVPSGKRIGRSKLLNITIPDEPASKPAEIESTVKLASIEPTETDWRDKLGWPLPADVHNPWADDIDYCDECLALRDDGRERSEIRKIHDEALTELRSRYPL